MSLLPRLLLALSLAALSASATSQAPATQQPLATRYAVELKFVVDGIVLGEPRITVVAGQPALMTVEKEGGYSIRTMVRNIAGNRVQIDATLYRRVNGTWILTGSPSIQTGLGVRGLAQSTSADGLQRGPAYRFEALVTSPKTAQLGSARPCTKIALQRWDAAMQGEKLALLEASVHQEPPTFPPGGSTCCSTGCLTCCGAAGTCCSDRTNCNGGCCVP